LTVTIVALMIPLVDAGISERILMNKKKRIISILTFSGLIGLVSGFLYLYPLLAKPLGPSLGEDLAGQTTPNFYQFPTPGQTFIQFPTKQPNLTQQPLITQQPPACGNTPVLSILVSGIDYQGDNYLYGLSDVIRIVRIDFRVPKIAIFTIDRDIWVEIPGIEDHYGITHGKLNESYFYGVPAMGYYDGNAGGSGLLAKTLNSNFGLVVDNYVVVSMAAFVKTVDALGGIDIYLPNPIDGNYAPGENLGSFSAGNHHLDGTEALNLARIRRGYPSLIRISDQDAIIKGLAKRISSPDIILKIPALLEILKDTVLTDLSPNQINSMVCLINKMDFTDLSFAEIPSNYYTGSSIYNPNVHKNVWVWDIDFNVIRSYVREFQSGRWP
jgi:LCP family protein required for cell wall assembly